MNALSILKRIATYGVVLLPMACLQQEVKPQPDKNTRACLLKGNTGYYIIGSEWVTGSWRFDYNADGNPVKWSFFDNGLNTYKTYTLEYEGLRLKRMNYYKLETIHPDSLLEYKTYAINADMTSLIEHSFRRNATGTFDEVLTRQCDFFRNSSNDLRLQKVEIVTPDAQPDGQNNRSGTYKRFEYDKEGRNVFRIWHKDKSMAKEAIQTTYGGFDSNGRSPWNANFWLSFIRGDGDSFINSTGFWSENNLSTAKNGTDLANFYYVYELNAEGFTCISSAKGVDKVPNPEETFYYYYNCDCRRR
ncbi:hypothetical protein [Spirosoma areae]